MKDGFDRSVAEKMPKMQKKRPNRPWNVDPVLLKAQDEEKAVAEVVFDQRADRPLEETRSRQTAGARINKPVEEKAENALSAAAQPAQEPSAEVMAEAEPAAAVQPEKGYELKSNIVPMKNESMDKAVETIKELSSDFTQMIFDRKAIRQELEKRASSMDEVVRENDRLKTDLLEFEKRAQDNTMLEREIDFLNEQLEDADLYIQNMVGLLEEKMQTCEQEATKRKELEGRFGLITREIQDKAKMDVKISILERDLSISTTRVFELESKLEEEYQKREPLELEIAELKTALDRVYSSLAHIRLKAKREVYGS